MTMQELDEIRTRYAAYETYGGLIGERQSVDDIPRTLGAIDAVLNLHESAEIYSLSHAGKVDPDGELLRVYCVHCTPERTLREIEDCEWDEDSETVAYPCETVTTIRAALTAQPSDTNWGDQAGVVL